MEITFLSLFSTSLTWKIGSLLRILKCFFIFLFLLIKQNLNINFLLVFFVVFWTKLTKGICQMTSSSRTRKCIFGGKTTAGPQIWLDQIGSNLENKFLSVQIRLCLGFDLDQNISSEFRVNMDTFCHWDCLKNDQINPCLCVVKNF